MNKPSQCQPSAGLFGLRGSLLDNSIEHIHHKFCLDLGSWLICSTCFYKNADGTYGYTSPLKGTDQSFNPTSALSLVPKGASIVGDYHKHADYSLVDATGAAIRTGDPLRDAFNSDHFSSTDYRGIAADAGTNAAYRGYLGTPRGTFRAYDPVGNREYVIKP